MSQREDRSYAGAARYGRRSRRGQIAVRGIVVLLVAAALAWLAWVALADMNNDVHSQVLDFRALDDHRVQVSVQVVADPRSDVTCTLRAQDRDHETTGVGRLVARGGGEARRVVRTVIETRNKAVVVTVVGCRARG